MKKHSLNLLASAVLIITATSCKNGKKAETTEAKPVEQITEPVASTESYKAIAEQTFVTWDAKKIVGGHQGTINASTGILEVTDGKISGGNFIIDINTIKATDIEPGEKNDKLVAHLKNEDFFDVAKFPNGAFQITSVTEKEGKTMIAGNLTLKDVKKNIEFPAMVAVNGDVATIKSEPFNLDRTEWNINFHSGKITDAAALGDKLIKDEVEITVNITAKK